MPTELEAAIERLLRVRAGGIPDGNIMRDLRVCAYAYLDLQSPPVLDWPDAEGWWWMKWLSEDPESVFYDGQTVIRNFDKYGPDWINDEIRFIRANVPVFPAREE